MEAGATIAAALGVTAAVLAPDPVWGTPAAAGVGALPTPQLQPDAELLALCDAEVARATRLDAIFRAYDSNEPPHVRAEVRRLVRAGHEAHDAIADLPAHTLAGARAKAAAVQAHWGEDAPSDGAVAASLVDNLLRLLPATGGRA